MPWTGRAASSAALPSRAGPPRSVARMARSPSTTSAGCQHGLRLAACPQRQTTSGGLLCARHMRSFLAQTFNGLGRWETTSTCARVQAAIGWKPAETGFRLMSSRSGAHFESPRQEEHCSNSRRNRGTVGYPAQSSTAVWPPCTGTLTRAGTLFGLRDSHECRRPDPASPVARTAKNDKDSS